MRKTPRDIQHSTVIQSNESSGASTVIQLIFYLGAGAIFHLLFMGSSIDWNNAWTYAIIMGWPVLFFVGLIGIVLTVALVVLAIAGGLALNEWIQEKRNQINR